MTGPLWRALFVLALTAAPLSAQDSAGMPRMRGAGALREQMERRLRQGLWRIAKERVGLDDSQMTMLEAVNHRYDARRRALNQDERAQRLTLRSEIGADGSANQERIASALERMLQLQRQRLDIVGEEQKELAGFMTPLQRAKYVALQEQLRRRADALRRARVMGGAR